MGMCVQSIGDIIPV